MLHDSEFSTVFDSALEPYIQQLPLPRTPIGLDGRAHGRREGQRVQQEQDMAVCRCHRCQYRSFGGTIVCMC